MKTLYIAHNCCFNSSYDLNIIKEGLKRQGYRLVAEPESADEIIFSGCGAHSTWVDDAIRQVNQLSVLDSSKPIIVTGCVIGIDAAKVRASVNGNEVTFRSYLDLLASYTSFDFDTLDGEFSQNQAMDYEGSSELNMLRRRIGKEKLQVVAELERIDRKFQTDLVGFYKTSTKGFLFYHETEPVEFISVSRSCLYKCSYCAIPRGRGVYTSVPEEAIIGKVRSAFGKGTKRIALVGDEVGNYGIDLGNTNLPMMLRSILALDSELKIGIRYIEPTPFLRYFDVLKELCDEGRIYLLYVPLQTGSKRILHRMNRHYDLIDVSQKIRTLMALTDTIFYSNWIVGFPSETESDFQRTIKLAKEIGFHINTAIPFSQRPDTQAVYLPNKVPDHVAMERLNRLRAVFTEMKLQKFRELFDCLEVGKTKELLRLIKEAEVVKIKESPSAVSARTIPIHAIL